MLVLSPSVAATKASARSRPASRRISQSSACPIDELAREVVAQQLERVGVLVDDADVVSRRDELLARPGTRPGRTLR